MQQSASLLGFHKQCGTKYVMKVDLVSAVGGGQTFVVTGM